MVSPQQVNTTPPREHEPGFPAYPSPQQVAPMHDSDSFEALVQRLMSRMMPEILYQVRATELTGARRSGVGTSLALAIVSVVLLLPAIGILLNIATVLGGGITTVLVGMSIVGATMVLINVLFNYMLLRLRS